MSIRHQQKILWLSTAMQAVHSACRFWPHYTISFCLLILCITPSSALAQQADKPQIEWLMLDWRPAWILDGPMKGLGYSDRLQALLIKHMPDYEHKEIIGNWARLEAVNTRSGVCNAAAFYEWPDKNGVPRTDIVWSAPSILFFYHGIIARNDSVAKFRERYGSAPLPLAKLLADNQFRFGAQPDRPFSKWLDPILNNIQPAQHIIQRRSNSNLSKGMFDLLQADRIDYFVDYYAMLRYRELSQSQRDTFSFLPIEEHEGTYGLGAFGCAKAGGGKKVIARINEVLTKIRHLPEFKEASSDWFMHAGNSKEFNRLWETEFMTRVK